MAKTIRTIRSEIEKDKGGIIPDVTQVIDTNILVDYAWSRDSNVTELAEDGYTWRGRRSNNIAPKLDQTVTFLW